MEATSIRKKTVAVLFLLLMIVVGFKSNPLDVFVQMRQFFVAQGEEAQEAVFSIDVIKENQVETLWQKGSFIDLNGAIAKILQMKGYYSDMGIYLNEDGYIVSIYPEQTTTDYEYEQVAKLNRILEEEGIDLLYVNAPIKYLDDKEVTEEFGVASYKNQEADLLLERLEQAGVPCLDLRDEVLADGKESYAMFFRTDHHWKIESGFWATKKIVEALNEEFDYQMDLSIYDADNYVYTEYKACWLGEQGKKLASSYVGLDDFTVIEPKFDTNFHVTTAKGEIFDGTFDIFINKERFEQEGDVYENRSWYYSYMPIGIYKTMIQNNNVNQGKALLIMDSYSYSVAPFLSLSFSELSTMLMRSAEENFDLVSYIKENNFDTVIICYAEFMIGAHDNPYSSNYKMFSFD